MDHRHRMLRGELYDPMDPELVASRERARDLCQALNATREAEQETRRSILREFGAGSVVTRDVLEATFAAGNPCRVIRDITDA